MKDYRARARPVPLPLPLPSTGAVALQLTVRAVPRPAQRWPNGGSIPFRPLTCTYAPMMGGGCIVRVVRRRNQEKHPPFINFAAFLFLWGCQDLEILACIIASVTHDLGQQKAR